RVEHESSLRQLAVIRSTENSLQEVQKLDKDDESLSKYEKVLLGSASMGRRISASHFPPDTTGHNPYPTLLCSLWVVMPSMMYHT
uniref:Uncharacterized protein n=1 Tax=Astyanax mexicanus TaxID=7994 RepID=A0A3B1J4D7_ASTMX